MPRISAEEVKEIFEVHYLPSKKITNLRFAGPVETGAGMSEIFSVINTETNEEYILKVVTTYNEAGKRLINREAFVNAAYNEIVALYQYYDTGRVPEVRDVYEYKTETDFVFFIIMKKYSTLGEIELRSEKDIYDITVDILSILSEIHKSSDFKGAYNYLCENTNLTFPGNFLYNKNYYRTERRVIHRDIKPVNILVYTENGKRRYILADYGTVIFISDNEDNISNNSFSTPIYEDVELTKKISGGQSLYSCDINSDIFSLGKTIKHLLTAAQNAVTYSTGYKKNFSDALSNPEKLDEEVKPGHVSAEFWNIIDRMTLRSGSRYQNADEVLADLEACYKSGYISEEEFPNEIIERSKIIQLVKENKKSELCAYAKECYERDPDNDAYFRLYVYANNARFVQENTLTSFIEELMAKEDMISRCLAAVLMLRMVDDDKYDPRRVEANEIFEELAQRGCIPAMYFYTRKAKYNWLADWSVLTNYYDKLRQKAYVPGMRDFLKVLRKESLSQNLCLDEDEKESIAEELEFYLEENNIEDRVAFFEYLY